MKKNILLFLLLFSFSIFGFSQNSCEENLDKAKELLFENYPFNDGETIFELINSCSNKGNTEAESLLGLLYLNGIGTNVNEDLAFKHISNAANKGFATAQYNLGRMYKYGVGCDLNYETAIEWFEKASKNGNQRASYSLGYMYFKGLSVSQNYGKAIYWFEQSEDYMAKHYLGLSYYLGYGVEPNETKALELLLKNPIQNSKALVTYILNNRKQKIEADVNVVLEENETESEKDLKLEKTATNNSLNSTSLQTVTKKEILGEWEGKFIQYDWSGKTIVRILPIELSLNSNNGKLEVVSSFEGEKKNSKAVWQDSNLYFKKPFNFTLDKLFSHDPKKLTLDYRLLSLDFKKQVVSTEPYLVVNVDTYIDEWKEYGRPSRIVLKRKDTASNLDEDVIATLPIEDQFIKAYPVPFKDQLTVQYELKTAGIVHVELISIYGGKPIIIKSNEMQQPGDYKYAIATKHNLRSGLYVVRLTAGNQLYTRLIIKEN